MKKNKFFSNFKKIIIVILCSFTLFFSMPIKSKASIWEDLVDVVLELPDAVMAMLNWYVSGKPVVKTDINLNLKGWDGGTRGTIYNFEVTPFDIFTSGLPEEYKDYKGNSVYTYTKLPLLDINFFRDDNERFAGNSADILKPVVSTVYNSLRNLVLVLMMVILLYIGVRIVIASAVSDQVKYKQWLVDWVVGICLVVMMQYIMSFLMEVNQLVLDMLGDNKATYYYISLSKLGSGTGESSWGDIKSKATPGSDNFDPEYEYFFDKHLDIANSEADLETINDQGNFRPTDSAGTPLESGDPFQGYFKVDSRLDWGKNEDGVIFTNARIYRFAESAAYGATRTVLLPVISPGASALSWLIDQEKMAYFSGDSLFVDGEGSDWADKTIYRCNLMEYIRTITTFGSKYVYIYKGNNSYTSFTDSEEVEKGNSVFMGYALLYLLLVIETLMFLYTYIKRVFKLAFYTMIAPLIAFMYPIDKLGDGKAQAFNAWFKEYLFNVLIQPLHLLLYTIFIYSAMELMHESIIYAIGAYAYMIAAEKFFKKIFGFDKAPSGGPGALGSPLAGGLAMRGLDKISGKGPFGKGAGKVDDKGKKKNKINFATNPNTSPNTNSVRPNSNGIKNGNIPSSGGFLNRAGGYAKGIGNTLSKNGARFVSGGKTGNWNQITKGMVIRGAGGRVGKAAKWAGKKAAGLGGGLIGGAAGLAAGVLSGTIASAVTGEDKMADAMQKGALAGGAVGMAGAQRLYDKAGSGISSLHQSAREWQASENGGGDTKLAATMKYENLYEEIPDVLDGMTKEEKADFMNVLEQSNNVTADNAETVLKNIRNGDSANEITESLKANKEFGDLRSKSNMESYIAANKSKVDIGKATPQQIQEAKDQADKEAQARKQEAIKKATKELKDAKAETLARAKDVKDLGGDPNRTIRDYNSERVEARKALKKAKNMSDTASQEEINKILEANMKKQQVEELQKKAQDLQRMQRGKKK